MSVEDEATINLLDCGAGESTLIFLHYFGGSSRTWLEVIEHLKDNSRCIAPDLRGFGESQPTAGQYAMADYADDLEGMIQALGLTRYILIGHSMGGKIALAFAVRQPTGLQSLVLIAPSPPTPEPMSETERSRLLSTHGERTSAEETAHKIAVRPLSSSQFNQVIDDNLRSSEAAWRAWLKHGSREDLSSSVAKINVPTLVIIGGADPVLSPHLIEQQVVNQIVGAHLEIVSGAGHLLPFEAPKTIAEHVRLVL
ncbi:MAG: alpha/beta hydrolase [Anaerolineae bacterium]|nr:alpha/beta hydrolase [Gloeobacterales cyanobacterium ES-bin-313]